MKNKLLLFLILVGIAIRLLIIFNQKQIVKLPDSELYLSIAKNYFNGNFHPNLIRTPGYSFFVYLVFLIFGWGKLKIIFLIQHLLTLLSCILIYKILEKKIKNKILLFFISLLMFTNYGIAQWGQILMPEALLIFFASFFAFLTINGNLNRNSISPLALITLIILGFIKPLYLSFTFVYLIYLFLSRKKAGIWIICQSILLIFVILIYMFWNKSINGFFGISTSDSTTVFGKIINFKMENCPAKQDSIFHNRLQKYLSNGGKRDWYQFVYSYKNDGWGENLQTFQKTYEFNNEVIKNCPAEYAMKSISSIPQTFFTYKNYLPLHYNFLKPFSNFSVVDYLWSFIFIFSLPFAIRKKKLMIMSLFILYNILSIFLFAADSFYRLRVPFELLFYVYLILFFEKNEDKTEEKIAKS